MSLTQVGVIAAVGGVVVSIVGIGVAIYLNNENARRHRISEVVDEYVGLCGAPRLIDCGPSAFIRAGARLLEDDGEVRETVRQIVARVGEARHPFGGHRNDVPGDADWKREIVDQLDDDGQNLDEILAGLT